jgi:hypothetical protein
MRRRPWAGARIHGRLARVDPQPAGRVDRRQVRLGVAVQVSEVELVGRQPLAGDGGLPAQLGDPGLRRLARCAEARRCGLGGVRRPTSENGAGGGDHRGERNRQPATP